MAQRVTRCLLCGNVDIAIGVSGRFVTTTCHVCSAVLRIEFDPPDEPTVRARIEHIEDGERPRSPARVRSGLTRDPQSRRAN